MKRALFLTGLAVVCVGLFTLAQGMTPIRRLALPDLMIREVTYQETGSGDFHTYKFGIGIKNIGSGQAGVWTKAAVYIMTDIYSSQQPWLFGTADVSPIAAGDGLMVFVSRQLSGPVGPCCVVVVVDAPVAGYPLGKMNEGTNGEMNNGFVFFFSPALGLLTYENPAYPD